MADRRPPGLVLRLALADLAHEWILTLCLVLAIAAVISPLLLLFGLKYGTIETLRYRLIQDPRNREVRPLVSRSFDRTWFERVRPWPEVAFVIPQTRQIAASVGAQIRGAIPKADLDLVPTAEGDDLVAGNGAPIPGEGEAVLSAMAAEALQARVGDTLTLTATRLRGSLTERAPVELRVAGILSVRAGALKIVYTRLSLLEAVERYKDGLAVPELGWTGAAPRAYAQYPGVLLAAREPMSPVLQAEVCNNTGFTRIEALDSAGLQARAGLDGATNRTWYLLQSLTRPGGEDNLRAVREKLRGREVETLPWVPALEATLADRDGAVHPTVQLRALPADRDLAERLDLRPLPDWSPRPETGPSLLQVVPPEDFPAGIAGGELVFTNGTAPLLRLPVALRDARAPPGIAYIPLPLAAQLMLARQRELTFDAASGELLVNRRGYAGFRMYARTIDEVDALRRRLDAEGIPVRTEAEAIRNVQELDHYLTLLFLLISAVGIAGSAASLLASLYASVERKKRELGVLRLLGLSGGALARFPMYQGAGLAAGGCGLAIGIAQGTGLLINTLFRDQLQAGEAFCRLPAQHMTAALGAAVILACLAALAAVKRLTRIEPAEALRDE